MLRISNLENHQTYKIEKRAPRNPFSFSHSKIASYIIAHATIAVNRL